MRYVSTHPRRVRGEAVHLTATEKRASERSSIGAADMEPDIQV